MGDVGESGGGLKRKREVSREDVWRWVERALLYMIGWSVVCGGGLYETTSRGLHLIRMPCGISSPYRYEGSR